MIIHSDLEKNEEFDDSNICRICYDDLNEDDTVKDNLKCVKLLCGHKYHYECIFLTFKSSKGLRKCPYCRKDGGYLPLIAGQIPIQYIHKEYVKNQSNVQIELIPNKCKYILTTGKNTGCQCKFSIKTPQGYCNMHIKKIIN